MKVEPILEPQPLEWAHDGQRDAFAYGPAPLCLSGGWGSAKTWLACMKILWLADTYKKSRWVIGRRVAKELRATTMATFFKVCAPQAYAQGRRNDQDGRLVLNNGSEILFMHFESPETQGIIRGLEINGFFIDQAEEDEVHMETNFDLLLGRIPRWDQAIVPDWMLARFNPWPWTNPGSGKPLPPPYAILAVNPEHELHWVYRRFHPDSPDHQRIYKAQGYRMMDFPTLGNRFLPDSNKAALLAHDDVFVQRNVYGRWGISEGQIHRIPAESIIEGDEGLIDYFRRSCVLHRSFDHGDSAPSVCAWWAVDRDGNSFCYREYYQPNQLISHHRREISALSEGERYVSNLADPSIFHLTMQKVSGHVSGRFSVASEYKDVSVDPKTAIFWTAADNNELGTRNRINEYLRVDPNRVHPITKQKGAPRLFFVQQSDSYQQGCSYILRETRSQKRLKIGTVNGKGVYSDERDPDVTDHGYDVVRYHIASRPAIAREPLPKVLPGTFHHVAQQYDEMTRQRTRRR